MRAASRLGVVAGFVLVVFGCNSTLVDAGPAIGFGVGGVKRRQTQVSVGVMEPGYTFGPWDAPSALVNVRFRLKEKLALQFDGAGYEYSQTRTTEYFVGNVSQGMVQLTEKTRFFRLAASVLYVKATKRFDFAIGGGGGFYGIEWIPDESLGQVDPELKGLQKKLGIQGLAEVDYKLGGALRLFTSVSFEAMQTQPHIDTSHHPKMARVHVGLRFGGGS